jgi:hypothetical protein
MPSPTDLLQAPPQGTLGFGQPVSVDDPMPASELSQQADLEQRRAKTSVGDYAGSMLRQDWVANNAMGALVGAGMEVDPNYNVFRDPQLAQLSKTVAPEQLQYLYRATSGANLLYTHSRLMEKQEDLSRLAQMGGMGQAGSMAFGFLDPAWLLAGGVAGKVTQLTRMATASRAAIGGDALAQAGARAAQAARGSTAGSLAAGVATGGVENAAIEWGRQQVSMEDSDKGILAAGLMGMALSAPFVGLGLRRASRIRNAANQELDAIQALQAAVEGRELTPEQTHLIQETHARAQDAMKLENPGGMSEEQYLDFLKAYHERWDDHVADAHQFSESLDADTRSKAQTLIDQFYTAPEEHAAQLAELQHQNRLKDIELQRQGRAAQREKNLAAAAEAHRAGEEAANTGPHGPALAHLADAGVATETELGAALKRAMKARDEAHAAHQAAENARAVKAGLLTAEEAAAQSSARASKKAAWDAADAADAARKQRDFEAMIRDRELTRMLGDEPVHGTPAEAPSEPVAAPEVAPQGDTSVAPSEAPAAAAEAPPPSLEGKVVTFTMKNGEMGEGVAGKINGLGKLLVTDENGKVHSVDPSEAFESALAGHPDHAPEGFLPGSVGAAQIGHIVRTPDAVGQNSSRFTGWQSIPGTNGKLKAPPRLDLYAFLNESKIPGVRALANILIKDPVGKKDGSVQTFTASEWRTHFKGVIGGEFHRTADEAYREAVKLAGVPVWKRGEFRQDFYAAASQALRGDHTVLQGFDPAVRAQVQKVSAALRKGLDRYLEEAKKAGVEGAAGVPPNASYVNRIWRQDKIREAMRLHGEDHVYQLLADSLTGMGAHGPLTGDVAKAKSFLGVVMKLEYSPALQNINLGARDMGALRDELRMTGKLSDSDIDTLVDVMFEHHTNEHADAGQATPLKFRFDLDETTGQQTPAGMLRISDLLENDARVLLDRYGSTMGGHAALGKVGIRSQAEFAAHMKAIEEEISSDPVNLGGKRAASEIAWLHDIQANILGRPMSTADFSNTARFASAFRGYARSTMLGQLGLSAAFEMKQAIGIMGVRAFLQQMPSFAGFIGALRRGYLPEQGLARDVMMIGGWGQEKASAYARAREIDEGFAADFLTGAEHRANQASHVVDIISGNASFTSLTKQISAMMSAQRLHDFASGLKTMTKSHEARLAGQGLDGQLLQDTMRDLKAYADVSGDRVTSIRHEEWLRDEPDTYEAFQGYMARQVRDSIQDHDLGETMPFMHSTLGKMFGELKTFFFVAHAKNLLKNVHYMDGTTMQVFLMGFLGESLAYSIQQAMNNPGDLDRRLSPEVMGPAIWARMASLGFTQMVADTGFQMVTGHSMLMSGSTSSGTNNRNLLMTPSLALAGKLAGVPGDVVRGIGLGTRPLLQQEAKDAWSTLPAANTYGLRGVGQWLSESFPKSAPTAP